MPLTDDYETAQSFLKAYGRLLVGSDSPGDLVEDRMSLDDDAQRDLWDLIKTFPYPTRARRCLASAGWQGGPGRSPGCGGPRCGAPAR